MRFSLSQIPSQAWKNGGGTTQELARGDAGAQMLWRVSLARIDRDGAFSAFPGLSRIHCIITGRGLTLSNPDHQLEAAPLVPLHFDGGLALSARLRDGPCQAFNLIYDPAQIAADMQICESGRHQMTGAEHVIFGLDGELQLNCAREVAQLGSGEGIQCAGAGWVEIAPGGRAVVLTLKEL